VVRFQRLDFTELGSFDAPLDLALVAKQQLVLKDQLQKLGVAELVT
jgi:hypothetical protein